MSAFYRSTGKKICISFDWHNDRNYRNLLKAWVADSDNPVDFVDLTPGEIDTSDVTKVKGVLTTQIRAADYTLVLIGAHANDQHEDTNDIGTRNWIWWEVEKSNAEGNKLIVVKIESKFDAPDPVYGVGAVWANSFTQSAILEAISKA